ncbi:MAG TPA: NAD(P)(+) transhydrogenase (Re/Si-specific) subunit beta [Mycobacteriales bacterium]|nr:NAD(P)(+) transhydrogenase (Re/Si-specific) subunit beta [Mycobacteriales bacterium]
MSDFDTTVRLCYLAAAAAFVLGLHLMNSPARARRGNQLSAAGMTLAIAVTIAFIAHAGTITNAGWTVLILGTLVGTGAGLYGARVVQMTDMPQLVSIFNAVGGGGAALVALAEFVRAHHFHGELNTRATVATVLDVAIGAVTFTGSLIAAGKLQGKITGSPVVFPAQKLLNAFIAAGVGVCGGYLIWGDHASTPALVVVLVLGLVFGVTMVMPIGGADMPVVISLLNAFTGTAVAMAGFVIDNSVLIIAGALVGASGSILTKLMADAMNRSIRAIIVGGFGTGDAAAPAAAGGGSVRAIEVDDVALQLAYANKVIFVPGYGLAVAQAQHEMAALGKLLEDRGVDVSYAIHPVAGRMPGHMNVLLAEANVPYPLLKEMEEINPEFARADVALVVGANDVVNPAARRNDSVIAGMPILDVDHAKSVVVMKRSMASGYAGIDNELFTDPKTGMFFADAKAGLAELVVAVKTLVAS